MVEGDAGAVVMNEVVGEFRELIENDVGVIARKFGLKFATVQGTIRKMD